MKLSITTTITNPIKRQDPYLEAIQNYAELADEVIVVDGGSTDGSLEEIAKLKLDNVRIITKEWPENWKWEQICWNMNYGIQACTGDWIIKMDIDRFFREKDFGKIRRQLEENIEPIASFACYNFPLVDRYFSKGMRACAIKGDQKHIFKLGRATNQLLSLSHPVRVKGEENGIPYGVYAGGGKKMSDPMINYDSTFKDKKTIEWIYKRYWRAFKGYYGGGGVKDIMQNFIDTKRTELENADTPNIGMHPEIMHDKIKNITPDKFGHSAWGEINFKK